MMEKHYLTLFSDSFLWLKGNSGLVYNSNNKQKFKFALKGDLKRICSDLLKLDSLYSVELTNADMENWDITQWIDGLVNINAGKLVRKSTIETRPVSLMPMLKIQDDIEYYKKQHELGYKGKILQNLHELTFYINGSQRGNLEYFKQMIYPINSENILSSSKVFDFINNCDTAFLSNINIVGCPFSYIGFEELINGILEFSVQVTVYVVMSDILEYEHVFGEIKLPDTVSIHVILDNFTDINVLNNISNLSSISVPVFSENEYTEYSNLLDDLFFDVDISFVPLFNDENISFFKKNVFVDEVQLEELEISKNLIFMHQAFNTTNFGRLTIMPDEKVFANVNKPMIGMLDDSPYSIVFKEFVDGESWFDLRDKTPCDKCVYQWLCPSPSNYETIIGAQNLCNIQY